MRQPFDRSGTTGFGFNPLDRLSGRREDAAFVEGLARDPSARFLLFARDQPLVRGDADPVFGRQEAEALGGGRGSVFLGCDETGAGWFAEVLPGREPNGAAGALPGREAGAVTDVPEDPDEVRSEDLRSLGSRGALSPALMGEVGGAKSVLDWHRRHGFCANCGHATAVVAAGWRRECPQCGAQHFPRVDPVVIMLAVRGDRCLVGRQAPWGPGMHSALAGFLEPGETIEDAVRREVMEEAAIPCGRVAFHASQPWPFPSQLMIGCFAEALDETITVDRTELEAARWVSRDEVAAMLEQRHPEGLVAPMPFAIAHELMTAFVAGAPGWG